MVPVSGCVQSLQYFKLFSFYPSTCSTPSVRADSSSWRDTSSVVTKPYTYSNICKKNIYWFVARQL